MEGPAYAVEELAKAWTIDIVLNVAIVGAIEHVEYAESDSRMFLFERQPDLSQDLEIG